MIPIKLIEKAIILVCKNHFGGHDNIKVDKLINYIYHGTTKKEVLISVKVKFLRKLFNKLSNRPYEIQILDIEKRLLDEKFWNKSRNQPIRDYFEICYEHYQIELSSLKIQDDNGNILVDIEITEDERKEIENLLRGEKNE